MAENSNLPRLLKFGFVALLLAGAVWGYKMWGGGSEENPELRRVAQLAHDKNASGLVQAMKDSNAKAAARAIEEFSKLRPDEVPLQVEPYLKSNMPELRMAAVSAYTGISDPEKVAPVKDTLVTDPDSQVRSAAAQTLGELHSYSGLEALVRGLDDPDTYVRACSIAAIHKILGVKYPFKADAPRDERLALMARIRADYPKFRAQIYKDNATGRLRRKQP